MKHSKGAFTLIEVMVAVVIISVVIMGLIQMYSNNTHIFSSLKNQTTMNAYSSLLVANKNYGFEDDDITLYRLVEEFDLETDLRRELKEIKVEIVYQELDSFLSEDGEEGEDEEKFEEIPEEGTNPELMFEIGKSIIKTKEASSSLVRLRLQ